MNVASYMCVGDGILTITCDPISAVSLVTVTSEASWAVGTGGIRGTDISTSGTLINI